MPMMRKMQQMKLEKGKKPLVKKSVKSVKTKKK